ncbi:hypothetical protein C2E23DRAFT_6824 [Lenzites betulinus]|nr:hypothetical protein C2E23DRAFT_6824 [Lenzites betulinus]
MPARTLPTPQEPALSPPRFLPRPLDQPHPHRRRGSNALNDRPYQPHALIMPAQLMRIDTSLSTPPPAAGQAPVPATADQQQVSHPGWPAASRVYPDPASIPPHWPVHPLYRDGRPTAPSGAAPQSTPPFAWARAYNVNPYTRVLPVQSFVTPPPPPIPHKVWILDCKSCGMFLTNRGMKAVLLLRPNVPLYSTDALPINCSAFSAAVDPPPPPRAAASSSSSRPLRSSFSGPSDASVTTPSSGQQPAPSPEQPPSRTCECLTQTLCCHGCGNAVGYMIVAPCQRCTSSITANNRATNGHRFVFYSSEITACKRHYVEGEPGVSTHNSLASIQGGMSSLQIGGRTTAPRPAAGQQNFGSPTSPTSPSMPSLVSSPVAPRTSGRRTSVDYPGAVPNSPSSSGYLSPRALAARSRASSASVQLPAGAQPGFPLVPPNSHTTTPSLGGTPTFASPGSHGSPPTPSLVRASSSARARAASTSAAHPLGFQVFQPRVQAPAQAQAQAPVGEEQEELRAGGVVYWHHLLRSGEIPAVFEDARARMDTEGQARAEAAERAARETGKGRADEESGRRRMSVGGRRVVAGR